MNTPTELTSESNCRPGRPRALDHVKQREILALVTAGFSIERAARYVDCAASTIRRECLRNPQFGGELRRAALSAELSPLQAIREAARKYWRAGVWLLEHMDPERFGKQNPRHVKPEQLEAFSSIIMEIISREVENPQERQRIYDKIAQLQKSTERLIQTARDTPPRRRSRRRAAELTPAASDLLAEIDRAVFYAPDANGQARHVAR
jgi:hypothetical protein